MAKLLDGTRIYGSANIDNNLIVNTMNIVTTISTVFDKANTSNITADAAFGKANSANITADAAFGRANTGVTIANLAFDKANSANVQATAAYGQANLALSAAQGAFAQANTDLLYANLAFDKANSANVQATAAYGQANTSLTIANLAFNKANTANITADAAFGKANSANITADAAFGRANTGVTIANLAFDKANSANVQATAAYGQANLALSAAQGAFAQANTVTSRLSTNGSNIRFNSGNTGIIWNNDTGNAGNSYGIIGSYANTISLYANWAEVLRITSQLNVVTYANVTGAIANANVKFAIGSDTSTSTIGGFEFYARTASAVETTPTFVLTSGQTYINQIINNSAVASAIDLYRQKTAAGAAANSDTLAAVTFSANDSAGAKKTYGQIAGFITSSVAGAERGGFLLRAITAGTMADRVLVDGFTGTVIGSNNGNSTNGVLGFVGAGNAPTAATVATFKLNSNNLQLTERNSGGVTFEQDYTTGDISLAGARGAESFRAVKVASSTAWVTATGATGASNPTVGSSSNGLTIQPFGSNTVYITGNTGIGTSAPGNHGLQVHNGSIRVLNDRTTCLSMFVGADTALTANATNYFIGVQSQVYKYNIPAANNDAGYRIGGSFEAIAHDTNFVGSLFAQYGVWARHGHYVSGAGSKITNSYGVYIEALTAGSTTITNFWGLYQEGVGTKNYFQGRVGIGSTSPGSNLTVTGNATISTTLAVGSTTAPSQNLAVTGNSSFSGNVSMTTSLGIGTTTPSTNLDVVGAVSIAKANVQNQTLTDGATITWDTSLGQIATVTLGGNRTMANATNMRVGTYILKVVQDGTGGRTLTWNTGWKWTAAVAPTLTTAANSVDIFTFYSDGTLMYGSFLPDVR